ncbi:Glucuronosyltransferase [Bertholletia excelsa]
MVAKPTCYKPRLKPSTLYFLLFSVTFFLLTLTLRPRSPLNDVVRHFQDEYPINTSPSPENPIWYSAIADEAERRKIKIGLVNMGQGLAQGHGLHGLAETIVKVEFNRVSENLRWANFFPEWIDENEKWSRPKCPDIPMPQLEKYNEGFDVVVAKLPCESGSRDVFRLQVNLVVANLMVRSGWGVDRTVYAVFIGPCGPMREIFPCEDLTSHEGDYWVYRPDLWRLKQKLLMPVGSCQLAPPYEEPGREAWRRFSHSPQTQSPTKVPTRREAYVTVLHSSETYVCGAVALAQSILRTNTTRDLVLLADASISARSLRGLRAAGWKVRRIERIRSPRARKDAYNEWNYTKLRIWQLIDYDKLIFIDSDLVVLKNMDHFFVYPQISAAGNDGSLFNSGVMLVEPSECTFEMLMGKRFEVGSYNGGDQGFLNEMFTWWHRLPTTANRLKVFDGGVKREVPEDLYTIHYLGIKPWLCYADYDCNWDVVERRRYASDAAHRRWWEMYKEMPRRLQGYCSLTKGMEKRIRKWRAKARVANLSDGHWRIKVKDPRRLHW